MEKVSQLVIPRFWSGGRISVLGINDEVFFVSRDGIRSLSTLTGN